MAKNPMSKRFQIWISNMGITSILTAWKWHRTATVMHAIHNNPYTRLSDRSCHLKVSLLGCREFYYIQMEKYARQGISEGLKNPDDLIVSTDTEIYRVLSLHYNRNNQIEVRLLCWLYALLVCVLSHCVCGGCALFCLNINAITFCRSH